MRELFLYGTLGAAGAVAVATVYFSVRAQLAQRALFRYAASAERVRARADAADAARMRKLCDLLDRLDDEGNGFPSSVHDAFQEGAAATRAALDRLIEQDREARATL